MKTPEEFFKEKHTTAFKIQTLNIYELYKLMEEYAEQHCEEKKIILYRALYNYMTEESGFITLSVHKTKQGARDAVARELRKEREKHNALYDYNVNEMAYRYGLFQAWLVDETEVQE